MKYIILIWSLFFVTCFADKEILIDLTNQKAYAMENGNIAFEGKISSGKIGRETPNGEFRIIQKKRSHRSNLWPKPNGGAKMPYMMRLTNSGIAMHLGYVPDKPASHGCIRLKSRFAQKLYKWAPVGTPVYVEGSARDYIEGLQYSKEYDVYNDEYGIIDYHY